MSQEGIAVDYKSPCGVILNGVKDLLLICGPSLGTTYSGVRTQ